MENMIKLSILISAFLLTVSIYTITSTDIDGNQINFSSFQGKKILIVNTATNSPYVSQYAGLEQLYQQYHDSLVVIVFPSNTFGHEPGDNASIKNFIITNYNAHYILGAKISVAGPNQAPIYQWLTQQSQNGMMNNTMYSDFQKYFVDKDGTLIGAFAPTVLPTDSSIIHLILGN
jgi:glutathione peroxidase